VARFVKGQSGNPKGRAKGSRNKANAAIDKIVFANSKDVAKRLAAEALAGQSWAITLMLKNRMPERTTQFDLPPTDSAADLPAATQSVLDQMSSGAIPVADGQQIISAIESHGRVLTLQGHEERLAALERQLAEATGEAQRVPSPEKSGGLDGDQN
jgi:hypothetical protein